MQPALKSAILSTIISSAVFVAAAAPSTAWQARVSKDLLDIYAAKSTTQPQDVSPGTSTPASQNRARFDAAGRVQIDVNFDCAVDTPTAELKAAGLIIGTAVKIPPMCVVEGWVAPSALPTVASLAFVKTIELPHYAVPKNPKKGSSGTPKALLNSMSQPQGTSSTQIDGEGIVLMRADQYIQQTSVTGAGVNIAVISGDVANLATIQARGELPTVQIVQPSANPTPHPSLTDEGTMMLEEVHAVAPAANLAFCGPETFAEYVGCLTNLVAAGITVISDDITYFGLDIFTAPTQNQNAAPIETILTSHPNVMLFHSVGNNAANYSEQAYLPVALSTPATCTYGGVTQTDYYVQEFTALGSLPIYIVWNTVGGHSVLVASPVPAGQATANNFDVYVVNSNGVRVACATSASGFVVGGTSYTFIDGIPLSAGTYYIYIATADTSLSGAFLKILGFGDGADTFSPKTSGGPNSPQDFAAGVISVGAVNGSDGTALEYFSETGPIQLEFPAASTLPAPTLVAPDAIYVDNANTYFTAPGGIFYGTSAASPNAAAVAALLRSAFPVLTPAQLTSALQSGATALGSPNPNGTFGYGRVDAIGALGTIAAPTISGFTTASIVGGKSSTALPVNIAGTGNLAVSITPASLIPTGSSGVQLSPSNCGSGANACTVVLTPTLGQSGSTTVALTVADGANRTMTYQASVTVTKPPAPTVSITSGGSQSVTVGAALAPVAFTLTGTPPLTVTPATNNSTSLALSSGCGTTTMSCTATLGAAPSTSGTATLMLTVQDSYAQTAAATASVTATNPPSSGGGGGSIDLASIIALGGLLSIRLSRSTARRH